MDAMTDIKSRDIGVWILHGDLCPSSGVTSFYHRLQSGGGKRVVDPDFYGYAHTPDQT